MWTYQQSTGQLHHDGTFVAFGYSGAPHHVNKPDDQRLPFEGPIPRGRYVIGPVVIVPSRGPLCIDLEPTPGQRGAMFGRGGFLIHGDSIAAPGTASHGCIILARRIRQMISDSSDRNLEVIR